MDSVCEDDRKRRTYRELLPAVDPKLILVASDEKGKMHELMERSGALLQLKNAGYKFAEERARREELPKERTPDEIAAAERAKAIEGAAFETAMQELQDRIASGEADHRKALLAYAVSNFSNGYVPASLYKRHGFKTLEQFEKRLPKLPISSRLKDEGDTAFRKLIGMLLESESDTYTALQAPAFLKDFGVDFDKHRKQAEAKVPAVKTKKK
jgi:hypothetical protein